MQPLKILAFVIGAIPIAAFLLTLYLTEGAPLQSLAPGEESGPAAATQPLPQIKPERQGNVAAVGHRGAGQNIADDPDAAERTTDRQVRPPPIVNVDRDAAIFRTLFGVADLE